MYIGSYIVTSKKDKFVVSRMYGKLCVHQLLVHAGITCNKYIIKAKSNQIASSRTLVMTNNFVV